MLRSQYCRICALIVLVLGTSIATAAAQDEPSRIRVMDDNLRDTFNTAYDHSASFRDLIEQLEHSNLIVYVQLEPPPSTSMDGATRFMVSAAEQRYLRVSIRPLLSRWSTIAMLAHELTHATEIAQAPNVRNADQLSKLYRTIGFNVSGDRYETESARRMTDVVLKELDDSTKAEKAAADDHLRR